MLMKNKNVFRLFVLFGLFLFSFVFASDSSTETEFNLDGCTFVFEGEEDGIFAGQCSSGVAAGYFYCQAGTPKPYIWPTRDEGVGCSLGSTTYNLGDDFCCPPGMFCNETDSGLFRCDRRPENCFSQEGRPECEDNGCVWMDITNECVENPRDYDCGYYDNPAACSADMWDLGSSGVGTEACGSFIECNGETFTVPESACGCSWYPDAPSGDKCQFDVTATQTFHGGSDPDRFSCSNVYELGDCIAGSRNVSWSSHSSIISGTGFGGVIPSACLDVLGCNGGEATQFCGEEIIKLPGFSLFSLFASIGILGFYYFRVRQKGGFELL